MPSYDTSHNCRPPSFAIRSVSAIANIQLANTYSRNCYALGDPSFSSKTSTNTVIWQRSELKATKLIEIFHVNAGIFHTEPSLREK